MKEHISLLILLIGLAIFSTVVGIYYKLLHRPQKR
jgi:hypothetical protein